MTDTRDYKAFGLTNASSGSNPNRFWWVGRLGYYWQPDTSDHWVRARVYRPQVGRWVSRDPQLQGREPRAAGHAYVYGAGAPATASDPSGRATVTLRTREECRDNKGSLQPDPYNKRIFWAATGASAWVTAGGVGVCFCHYKKIRRQLYRGYYVKECRTVSFRCEVSICARRFRCGWDPGPWEIVEAERDPWFDEVIGRKNVRGSVWATQVFMKLFVSCVCENPGTGAHDNVPMQTG